MKELSKAKWHYNISTGQPILCPSDGSKIDPAQTSRSRFLSGIFPLSFPLSPVVSCCVRFSEKGSRKPETVVKSYSFETPFFSVYLRFLYRQLFKSLLLRHIVRPKKISHRKTQKLQRFPGFFTSIFEVEIKRYPRGIGGI